MRHATIISIRYRRDDRGGYEVGQTVRLRCYDPDHGYHGNPPLDRRITNILRGGEFELPMGYCILSLAPLSASAPASGAERMTAGEYGIAAEHAHFLDLAAARLRADGYPANAASCSNAAAFLRATPAPATPPGVPDSVRALSETRPYLGAPIREPSLREILIDHYQPWFSHQKSVELADRYIAALATHPAGQSAGSGAGGKMRTRHQSRREEGVHASGARVARARS